MTPAPRSSALLGAAAGLRLLGHLQRDARRRDVAVERVISERIRAERRAPSAVPVVQGALVDYIQREFLSTKEQDWSGTQVPYGAGWMVNSPVERSVMV